jgi:hypothetical protein
MWTWTLGINAMQGQFQTEWGMYAAASVLIMLPVVLLFLYSAKWLVSGLTLGSVKGCNGSPKDLWSGLGSETRSPRHGGARVSVVMQRRSPGDTVMTGKERGLNLKRIFGLLLLASIGACIRRHFAPATPTPSAAASTAGCFAATTVRRELIRRGARTCRARVGNPCEAL